MENQRDKKGRFVKGHVPWYKGKTCSERTKQKIRNSKYHKNLKKENNPFFGKKHFLKTKKIMSKIKKGKHISPKTEFKKGNKNRLGKKHTKEAIEKIKKARAKLKFPFKDSSIEVKIQNFLKQLRIKFFTHQYMDIKHPYRCDILIPSLNTVIECDGDYWHSFSVRKKLDKIRTKEMIGKGFKVLRLKEKEIKAMNINNFKNKFKEVLNVT